MARFAFVLKQFRLEDEGLKPRRGQSIGYNLEVTLSGYSLAGGKPYEKSRLTFGRTAL